MKLQQVTERIARLTDVYLDQAIEKDLFEERKASLLFERQEVQEALHNLRDNNSVPDQLRNFLELAGDAYSLYQNAFFEKKRRLLQIMTSNLSLDHKSIDFAFSIPFLQIAAREKSDDGGPSKGWARTWDNLLTNLSDIIAKSPAHDLQLIN